MVRFNYTFFRFFVTIVLLAAFLYPLGAHAKKTYGLYERVLLVEWDNTMLKAKLDTGALTSSLNAVNIEFFEKDGEDWVRFQPQIKGDTLPVMEKEVLRYSRIKLRTGNVINPDKKPTHNKRPVVLIDVCFDGTIHSLEVNLTNRSRFVYPLLLGSSSLTQLKAVVDPSLKFQANDQCD